MNLSPGSLVFAYHGPLMYEAKVLKIHRAGLDVVELMEGKEDDVDRYPRLKHLREIDTYFLHYSGWNSKWDEWVGIERILEHNDENKLKKSQLDSINKRPKISRQASPALSPLVRRQQLGSQSSKLPLQRRKRAQLLVLKYDDNIKHILVDDWQFVTRDHQLVSIPAELSVVKILQDYSQYRLPLLDETQKDVLREVLNGLILYFDKLLHLMLLYKYENQQYFELLQKETISDQPPPSQVYGLEHLLRLIVTMPAILADSTIDAVSMNVIIQELERILQWVLTHLNVYMGSYINTSPQYDALSRQ